MANTTVSIRERIKTETGWEWSKRIPIPEGKLDAAEAQRKGKFNLVYTEGGRKREPKVKGKTFEAAVLAARAKQRHLEDAADGFTRPDPLKKVERKKISEAIVDRLRRVEISFDWKTLKAHRQVLRQFEKWMEKNHPNCQFVDQIDHDHVMSFRNWLLKNGNEKKNSRKKGNEKLTADWKAARVNQFVRLTLGRAPGSGPIKKSDLGKMKPNSPPEIYPKPRLDAFFKACKPEQDLRYRTLYEPAFRKEELMYLEKEDVLVEKQMLRVQSKTRYDDDGSLLYEYAAKAGSEREVPISKELMQRIVKHMNDPAHPDSRLVFCTSSGMPETHFWDKLQSIAKRAGLGGFNLKKFRATRATEWLRPKWLGGFGYDIPTVKNLLGHDKDGDSIWSYVRNVENEVLVAEMNKEKEKAAPTQPSFSGKGLVLVPSSDAVAISGVQAF
jgi:integrase